ncbi:hypothetical protein CROQUDRAFT_659413 [Cronartium quercuum f. sp. fusiforme G11]|uniref:lipoyl(octanoyl) transferase n=1 Tax=Cronartium quercuum f. sp. fusiforme G11 TaxID=708437 RepID=A0A9P6NF92_9BASI|nr:hypothetical protein CROQUDRAFT_659413 [Cronartium quercuum f. sp. fusiforme G11]
MLSLFNSQSTRSHSSLTKNLPPLYWSYIPTPVSYLHALSLQHALVRHKIDTKSIHNSPDFLLLLQHQPVYTTGRRTTNSVWLAEEMTRLARANPGADFISTLRGGQTTFHGPGQLVGYPILDIGQMGLTTRDYVDRLLKVLGAVLVHPVLPIPIQTLDSRTDPNLPVGTFVGDVRKKIASIGIQVRRRVTSHGFALNVEQACQAGFQHILACGLSNTRSISIESALSELTTEKVTKPAPLRVSDMVRPTVEVFGNLFGREMCEFKHTDQSLDPTTFRLLEELNLSTQHSSARALHSSRA